MPVSYYGGKRKHVVRKGRGPLNDLVHGVISGLSKKLGLSGLGRKKKAGSGKKRVVRRRHMISL